MVPLCGVMDLVFGFEQAFFKDYGWNVVKLLEQYVEK